MKIQQGQSEHLYGLCGIKSRQFPHAELGELLLGVHENQLLLYLLGTNMLQALSNAPLLSYYDL